MPPATKRQGNEHAQRGVQDALTVVDLVRQYPENVTEFLARHPEIASKIIFTIPARGHALATPENTPSPAALQKEDTLSTTVVGSSNTVERSTTSVEPNTRTERGNANRVLLPRPSGVESNLSSYVAVSGEQQHCASCGQPLKVLADGGSSKRKRCSSDDGDEPTERITPGETRRRLAESGAEAAVTELGEVKILEELRCGLMSLKHGLPKKQRPSSRLPKQYECLTEQEIEKHLKTVHCHFRKLMFGKQLATAISRYQLVLNAKHYLQCQVWKKTARFKGSLAIVFAKAVLPDWVRSQSQRKMTSKALDKALRTKWKGEMRTAYVWCRLHDEYGPGVFCMLTDQFKGEHARRLTELDVDQLVAWISDKHPSLKDDLKDLSATMTYIVDHGCLPARPLLLETLNEEILSHRSPINLPELLSFVDVRSDLKHNEQDVAGESQPSNDSSLAVTGSDWTVNATDGFDLSHDFDLNQDPGNFDFNQGLNNPNLNQNLSGTDFSPDSTSFDFNRDLNNPNLNQNLSGTDFNQDSINFDFSQDVDNGDLNEDFSNLDDFTDFDFDQNESHPTTTALVANLEGSANVESSDNFVLSTAACIDPALLQKK